MSFNSGTFLHSSARLLSNIRPWLSQAAPRTASTLLLATWLLLLQGHMLFAQSIAEPGEDLRAALQANGQSILLQWWGKSGRTYFVQTSPNLNLSMEWSYEGHVLTGTGTLLSISLPAQPSPSFIRLRYTDQQVTGDPYEADPDQDGLSNRKEIQTHGTNPLDSDTDDDGLPDGWEVQYGLSPLSVEGSHGAQGDPDGDTLKNLIEYQLGSSPINADTDGDLLPDWWEFRNQTSLISNLGQDGPTGDIDHDGFTNLEEYRVLSDPRNASSYPGSGEPAQTFGESGTNTPDSSFAAFLAYRGRWLSFRSTLTHYYPYVIEKIYYEREVTNSSPPPLNDGFNGDADPNENLQDPGDPRDIPDWMPTYWIDCDEESPGAVERIGTQPDYLYHSPTDCYVAWEEFKESIYTVETAYPGESGKLEIKDTSLDFSRSSALAAMESLPMYQGSPENGWSGAGRRPKNVTTVTSQWNVPYEGISGRTCDSDFGTTEEQSWPHKYSEAYMDQIQMRYQCNQPAPEALTQTFVLVKRETALSGTFVNNPVGPETVTVLGSMELRIEEGQMISNQASANFPLPEGVSLQGGTILLTSPPVDPGNRSSYDLIPVDIMQHPSTATSGSTEPPSTQSVRLCRWLDAYDSFLGELATTHPRYDRDRFTIRLPAEAFPEQTKITIKLATKNPQGTNDAEDGPTDIECVKNGDYLVSKPMILVGDHGDDTWDEVTPAEDQLNDPTHIASPGGKIEIELPLTGNAKIEFPVAPYTDKVVVESYVVRSPSTNIPSDLAANIETQVRRAKEVFKQAHILVDHQGPYDCMLTDASMQPILADTGDGARNLLIEGSFMTNSVHAEARTVFDKIIADYGASPNVVKLVFFDCNTVESNRTFAGWTVQDDNAKHGPYEGFIVIPIPNAPLWRTGAHEVGHAVSLNHPDIGQGKKYMLMINGDYPNDPNPEYVVKRFRAVDLQKMLSTPRPPFVQSNP